VLAPDIVAAAAVNGLTTGAIYALIAVGLTLVYGVLHIINFAHGAILGAAMFAAYLAFQAGFDPYVAMGPLAVMFFALGYGVQRLVISPASHGEDRNVLLVTLGLSIVIENVLLAIFTADTRTIDTPYGFSTLDLGFVFLSVPRAIGFGVACATSLALWALLALTDTGKAIRAVAKERMGAALVGIDPAHIFAVTFGLSAACLAIAACLLLPIFYVSPRVGEAYVLIAFTIVVLGGMGSVPGALIGGLAIGIVESLSGLFFGDSLGQLGVYLIFILVLLLRPTGLFGAAA
jgi:branched-chain amino acid transport system permease protein